MPLAIESGFPITGYSAGSGTSPSATITTAGASLLVVCVISGAVTAPADPTLGASGGTGSGNVGSWTKQVGRISGTNGFCWIYTAPCSGALTSVVITATGAWTNADSGVVVYSLTGASSTQPGAANGVNGTSGAAQKSFSTTGSQSLVVWCGIDIGGSSVTAAATNTVHENTAHTGDQYFSGRYNGLIDASTVTIGTSAPNNTDWVIGGIEVLAAEVTGTVSDSAVASDSEVADRYYLSDWFQSDSFASDAYAILGGSAGGGGLGLSVDEQDIARASDQLAHFANPVFGPIATDTALASDSVAGGVARNVAESDTANASDSEAYGIGLRYSQTDNAQANDSLDVALTKNVLQTDTARASDSLDIALKKDVAQSDTALASDTLAAGLVANVAQTDTALAGDQLNVILASAGVIAADQSDSAVASDIEAIALVKNVGQTDTALATDSFAYAIGIATSFSDAVQASDLEALALVKNVAQSDSAVALDVFAFAIAGSQPTGSMSDSAVASDAFAAAGGSTLTELSIINLWNGAAWVHWNGSTWV